MNEYSSMSTYIRLSWVMVAELYRLSFDHGYDDVLRKNKGGGENV